MKPIYWGLFLLENISSCLTAIANQHVTFGFKSEMPQGLDTSKTYNVQVVGYACDGINEGYRVEIPAELEKFYSGNAIKHITIGVANGGKPVDTANISFNGIEPFYIQAKFGYFEGGKVHIMN